MIMKFVLILFVPCIDLIFGSTVYNDAYWNNPVQFCGTRLGAEMSIICKGRYNDDQRSQPKAPQTKSKREIVDECCYTTCTRKFLRINYCGPETKLLYPTAAQLTEMAYVNYASYYWDLIWTVIRYPQPED